MMDKARDIALQTLYKIDIEGAYSNIILDEMIRKNRNNLGEKDIGLISEIVYGVTTWKLTLDEIVKKYSKIKIKKISPWILNILRMSIYQIIFLDKIPKSAAVNEGVNLAKRYGHKSSSGFTNAILRKVSKDDYEEMFKIKEIEEPDILEDLKVKIKVDDEEVTQGEDGMYLVEVDNSQDNSSLWAEVTTETSQVKIKDTNGETSYDSPSNQKNISLKENITDK